MAPAKLLSFALFACAVFAIIGRSSADFFSHDAEFGAFALNGPYPCGTCVTDGVLSYGCPAGAVCFPDGADYGVWSGPGTCFWDV
uniref:Putative secreted protein n=1 Tax=Amblyomma parvum TaxID=251391 RepID=A0A023G0G7_AMBPA